jgi:hypothetical protein
MHQKTTKHKSNRVLKKGGDNIASQAKEELPWVCLKHTQWINDLDDFKL